MSKQRAPRWNKFASVCLWHGAMAKLVVAGLRSDQGGIAYFCMNFERCLIQIKRGKCTYPCYNKKSQVVVEKCGKKY